MTLLKKNNSDKVDNKNFDLIKEFTEKLQGIAFMYSSGNMKYDRAYIFRDKNIACENDRDYKKMRKNVNTIW